MKQIRKFCNRILTFAQIYYPVVTAKIIRKIMGMSSRSRRNKQSTTSAATEVVPAAIPAPPQRTNGIEAAKWAARVPQ